MPGVKAVEERVTRAWEGRQPVVGASGGHGQGTVGVAGAVGRRAMRVAAMRRRVDGRWRGGWDMWGWLRGGWAARVEV